MYHLGTAFVTCLKVFTSIFETILASLSLILVRILAFRKLVLVDSLPALPVYRLCNLCVTCVTCVGAISSQFSRFPVSMQRCRYNGAVLKLNRHHLKNIIGRNSVNRTVMRYPVEAIYDRRRRKDINLRLPASRQ